MDRPVPHPKGPQFRLGPSPGLIVDPLRERYALPAMKRTVTTVWAVLALLICVCGCGQSKPEQPAAEQKSTTLPASQPAPTAQVPAAASQETQPAALAATPVTPQVPPGPTTVPVAPSALRMQRDDPVTNSAAPDASQPTEAASQLVAAAKTQGDTVLSSVGNDLSAKVKSLVQSAAGNETLKTQLTSSLKALAGGNQTGGLTTLYQTTKVAGLTPSQLQLAKEVGNLASAYVVQKNFASLDGAQGEVATVVNSLRQGQFAPAVPAVQKIAQNASLTSTQKELIGAIADKYAPGISKAAGALGQGLQSIPGLGGTSK
jgi:hypothetical protein